MTKVAFLDRDGTINVDHGYVGKWEDFDWIPGAKDALVKLKEKGFLLAIVTNQSGVARDYFSIEDVTKLHEQMNNDLFSTHQIKFDYIETCPFHPKFSEHWECRKPSPIMLENIAKKIDEFDKSNSIMIGDKDSDYNAGQNFGIKSYLIHTGQYQTEIKTEYYKNISEIVKTL